MQSSRPSWTWQHVRWQDAAAGDVRQSAVGRLHGGEGAIADHRSRETPSPVLICVYQRVLRVCITAPTEQRKTSEDDVHPATPKLSLRSLTPCCFDRAAGRPLGRRGNAISVPSDLPVMGPPKRRLALNIRVKNGRKKVSGVLWRAVPAQCCENAERNGRGHAADQPRSLQCARPLHP